MKTLAPIQIEDAWSKKLQILLRDLFHDAIYDELLRILSRPQIENASTGKVAEALRKGTVSFVDGEFRGAFSAAVSAELKALGAVWIDSRRVFKLSQTNMPAALWLDVVAAISGQQRMVTRLFESLGRVEGVIGNIAAKLSLEKEAEQALVGVDARIRASLTKAVGVSPNLSAVQKQQLLDDYTKNVVTSIRGFSREEVVRLREMIQEHVLAGRPRAELAKRVIGRLAVSDVRAEFVAKQETRLFTASIKQAQYQAVNIEKYVWQATKDSRCRPEHRHADGKVFYWEHSKNPDPVRNALGMPVHPQQDFGCRCLAKPIVEVI